jgi:hypothetical protein
LFIISLSRNQKNKKDMELLTEQELLAVLPKIKNPAYLAYYSEAVDELKKVNKVLNEKYENLFAASRLVDAAMADLEIAKKAVDLAKKVADELYKKGTNAD